MKLSKRPGNMFVAALERICPCHHVGDNEGKMRMNEVGYVGKELGSGV